MNLLLLIALGFVIWQASRYFRQRTPALSGFKVFLIVTGSLLLLATLLGKAPAIMGLLGTLLALLTRFSGLLFRYWPIVSKVLKGYSLAKQHGFTPTGAQSAVDHNANPDRWLAFLLPIDGYTRPDVLIRHGDYAGQKLSELNPKEVKSLALALLRHDPASLEPLMQHIKEHLAQQFDPSFSQADGTDQTEQQPHTHQVSHDTHMSHEQAYQVLGLEKSASQAEIIEAHKRLMHRLHPDKGGSDWLASHINQAKSVLTSKSAA